MRESQRLNETIKNFLAYAGPQRVTRATVDVRPLVRETANCSPRARRRAAAPGATPTCLEPVCTTWTRRRCVRCCGISRPMRLKAMPDGGTLRLPCGRQPTAPDAVAGDRGAGRRHRHGAGRHRTHVPAVPGRLPPGHRPRAVDRAPHRRRSRRPRAASVASGRGHARRVSHSGAPTARPPRGATDDRVGQACDGRAGVPARRPRILVVDDERSMREFLGHHAHARGLRRRGGRQRHAGPGGVAAASLRPAHLRHPDARLQRHRRPSRGQGRSSPTCRAS